MGSSHSNVQPQPVHHANDYDFVMEATRVLEHLLATRFGATGPDHPTMIVSVQTRLSAHSLQALRYVVNARMNVLCSKPQPRLTAFQRSKLVKAPALDRKIFLVHFEFAMHSVQGASSPQLIKPRLAQRKTLSA